MDEITAILNRLRNAAGFSEQAVMNDEPTEDARRSVDGLEQVSCIDPRIPASLDITAWAAELSEQGIVLSMPVEYVEAPLRTVTTERVSWYAAHYLRTITFARSQQEWGSWGVWTPEWWREREQEALGTLKSLREALTRRGQNMENSDG